MRFCIWLFLFFTHFLCAQQKFIQGAIVDATTGRGLSYAQIYTKDTFLFADANGYFSIPHHTETFDFSVKHELYLTKQLTAQNSKWYYRIPMMLKDTMHRDVEYHKLRGKKIAEAVLLFAPKNNIFSKYPRLQFDTYNTLRISAIADSIDDSIDTIPRKIFPWGNKKIDSTSYKYKQLLNQQHLFQWEKVATTRHQHYYKKENIKGIRMSGFRTPIYEILAFDLQSQNLYAPKYDLLENKYVNPISSQGINDYDFTIVGNNEINGHKLVYLYFKNKRRVNRNGLEGVLAIDANTFAITEAHLRVQHLLDKTSIHTYQYNTSDSLWYPKKQFFKIEKGRSDDPIKIFGGTIEFKGLVDDYGYIHKKTPTDFTYIESETYFSHFFDEYKNKIRRKSAVIDIQSNAIDRSDFFWNQYRPEPLDERSKRTFSDEEGFIFKEHIEGKLLFGRKIINGYAPVGFYDIGLKSILSFNNFEGFRIGIGGKTNERISKRFRLKNYIAYGTKDGKLKYNADFALRISDYTHTWIGIFYTDDVSEIANHRFLTKKENFKLYDPRPINVSTFYNHKSHGLYVTSKVIPYSDAQLQLHKNQIHPLFNYAFSHKGNPLTQYDLTSATASLSWHPYSTFMLTPDGTIEIDKGFPKINLQISQTIPKFAGNDLVFFKGDLMAEFEKKHLNGNKTSLVIQAGTSVGDIPLTHLYNTSPNNLDRGQLFKRITFSGKNSFETMYFNEFFSSTYSMFHLKYGFKRITILPKFKPNVVLVSRGAWGTMSDIELHQGISFKTLEHGYLESGVELNQLFMGFGLAGFYRYGPNQLPQFKDNIAVKISFQLDLPF